MPEQMLLWLIHVGDRYIIGYHWGSGSVGQYSAAYSLAGLVGLAAVPALVVIFPRLAQSWDARDPERARLYVERTVRYLLFLTIPMAFVLSAVSGEILRVFAGDGFVPAGVFVPFIGFGLMLHRIQGVYSYVLMAAKRTRAVMWVHGGAAVLNVCANLVLVPRIGAIGAAYVALGTYALGAAAVWVLARRSLRTAVSLSFIVKAVAASLAVAWGVARIAPSGIAQVVATVLGAGAVYTVLMLVVGGVTIRELTTLGQCFRPGGRG